MSGHGHDRPGAVAHHHVVSNPDRYLLAIDRVGGSCTSGDSGFVFVEVAAFEVGLGCTGCDVAIHGLLLGRGGDVPHERVLRSEDHVGGAEEGVRPGGEDGDLVTFDVEVDFGTGGFSDPVFLQ